MNIRSPTEADPLDAVVESFLQRYRRQAASLLRQAQRQYPGDLWINHLLAWLCLNALRPPQLDDAARFFSAALAVRPRSYYLTTGLGIALARKGSYQEAIAEFDKAIELKPDRALQWYCRGLTYTFIEEWKKALADFSMAIKLNPKYGAAWNYRG